MSVRIPKRIAREEGSDPLELDGSLYDVIDPDALDSICRTTNDVSVEFTYHGYRVVVHGDGRIDVREQES